MSALHKNYIAGEWVSGVSVSRNINPSDTNDVVGEYAQADAAQTDAAIKAAHAAFPAWARTTPQERHDILLRISSEILARREELARLLAREEGKTLPGSDLEVGRAGQIFDFFAGEALRIPGREIRFSRGPGSTSRRRASRSASSGSSRRGISPSRSRPGRSPPRSPLATRWCSSRPTSFPAPLTRSPRSSFAPAFPKASSTSSWGAARWWVRRCSITSGSTRSHSPARSRPAGASPPPARAQCANSSWKWAARTRSSCSADADLPNAVECAVNGAYFSTGQRCTASSRIIVEEPVYRRFADALIERMRSLVVDDALKAGTQIGPVVDATQLEQDQSYLAIGQGEGAKLALGGERLNRATPGFYMAPALFLDADNSMRISREEIFGPVSAMIPARDYDHALSIANDTEFGLCAGICTTSLKRASHFKRNAEAGMVMVNLPTAGVDYHAPFGGRKGSSLGPREQGRYAAEFYTTVKTAYTLA